MRLLAAIILLSALSAPGFCALRVITTTEDLAAIAREVGGKHIHVESIAKGYQDPHFVDAKPSYLLRLKRADLFVQVGLELEASWAPNLLRSARNRKIRPGGSGYLDASIGCDILDKNASADRSQGDVHPEGNPHYWLNPANGRVIAENIKTRLAAIDPGNAGEYENNLKTFHARLSEKEAQWDALIQSLNGTRVITYHNSWPNFANRFDLKVVGFIEPKPGIPASPSHISQIIDQIRKEKIPFLLMEPYFDEKLPRKIASETGAQLLVLAPSVGAYQEIRTYFDLFDYNLKKLADASKRRP